MMCVDAFETSSEADFARPIQEMDPELGRGL